ncbi:c-type cytochrome [Pigmentiphaga sp.]|jgi:Cytochrome c551/c552|uniref:c-type cytochrome n=1 Tax=Pigmentiphaga sp. TaxID=1977564 RepID=UPI0025FC057E|nr:c-type cytochrome [Pigmentiphaga sp.]MBX6317322.1 c-type cytochrome [Pigmentiphaga sp.]
MTPVRFVCIGALLALATLHTTAGAQTTGLDLAKSKNCLSCHQVDAKRVGPSYVRVAERYEGDPEAEARIIASIRKGSFRKWGAIPMPAQNAVSDEEARQLAQWILTLKPGKR